MRQALLLSPFNKEKTKAQSNDLPEITQPGKYQSQNLTQAAHLRRTTIILQKKQEVVNLAV